MGGHARGRRESLESQQLATGALPKPSFRDTAVSAFADDGAGKVWVGTIGAGLVEIDSSSGRERRYGTARGKTALTTQRRVMALLYDRAGVALGRHDGGRPRRSIP